VENFLLIAEMTKPLKDLLNKKSVWLWGMNQENAFQQIEHDLASNRVLIWYDPSAEIKISADASTLLWSFQLFCCMASGMQ